MQLRFWNFVDDDGVECAGFSEAKRHPTDLKDRWKVICKQLAEGRLPAHLVVSAPDVAAGAGAWRFEPSVLLASRRIHVRVHMHYECQF